MVSTSRVVLGPNELTGGINDTPFPDNRLPNQAKTLNNFRVRQDGTIEKTGGRALEASSFGTTGNTIHGLVTPPKNIPLITITSQNNVLNIFYKLSSGAWSKDGVPTLATGNYYTYEELAAALQTALATGSSGTWAVNYNVTTPYKFTITLTRTNLTDLVLCWYPIASRYSASVQVEAAIFGFMYSAYGSGSGAVTLTSEFEVSALPPRNRAVVIGGKMYDHDGSKTAVTFPNTSSLSLNTANKITGIWQGPRYYFSDGADNFVRRDQYVRTMPDASSITTGICAARTSTVSFHSQVGAGAAATMTYGIRQPLHAASQTCTLSIASPCVVTAAAHGFSNGHPVVFSTTGALPTGLTAGTTYYVTGAAAGTFNVAATIGGSAINTSGSQSGTHSITGLNPGFINFLQTKWIKAVADYGFTLRFYIEFPSMGERFDAGTKINDDLTASTGADESMTPTPGIYYNPAAGAAYLTILLTMPDASLPASLPQFYHVSAAGTAYPYQTLNEYGYWETVADYELRGLVQILCGLTSGKAYNWACSIQNAEGFETNLSPILVGRTTAAAESFGLQFWPPTATTMDGAWINFYRTAGDGEVYHLAGSISRKMADAIVASGAFACCLDGMADTQLLETIEANDAIVRTTRKPFTLSAWWNNRLWVTMGVSDPANPGSPAATAAPRSPSIPSVLGPPIPSGTESGGSAAAVGAGDSSVYFSDVNMPESFPAGNDVPNKNGLPVTGLCALGDGTRANLYMFSELGYSIIADMGGAYIPAESDSNIGTRGPRSIVPVRTDKGDILLFQGQDGHFYYASYPTSTPLSKGVLNTLVATFNQDALDQTVAFYDPGAREIRWSVCTGTNTVPDKRVILNLTTWGFSTDDMPAALWTADTLDGSTRWLGASYRDIFYDGEGTADFDPTPQACTFTDATDLITTASDHGFTAGDAVIFSTTDALPTGLTAGTTYYVSATGLTSDDFKVSETLGGAVKTFTGTGSGTHYVRGSKAITATWETADLDMGAPDDQKSHHSLEISSQATSAEQSLAINWYADCSDTAAGTASIAAMATSPHKDKIQLRGTRAKYCRFKFTNADKLGKISLNRLLVELSRLASRAIR